MIYCFWPFYLFFWALVSFFFFFFIFFFFWKISSIMVSFFFYLMDYLLLEFSSVIKMNNKESSPLFILSGFFFILFLNFFALFPSIFTVSGHILFTLSLSILFWSLMILFLLSLNFNSFVSHLVPMGTPGVLVSFMVLVELVSNIIRPITLSVRLMANMVAGHLLMGLLGGFLLSLGGVGFFSFFVVGMVLTILELAVSFIQSYVFLTLFSLYSEECH